jgi:DNA-3-methyladenine glycosylase II
MNTPDEKKSLDIAIQHLSDRDSILAGVIALYDKPTFQKHGNYYDELVSSIISQQLSVKAAKTIQNRFLALFGDKFPSPAQILARDIEELRSVGISRPKARYIQDLAQKVHDGEIKFTQFDVLGNDEIIAELISVKGIGEWTAHMFLIFCMGRLDVLATGDLGVRAATQKLYNLPELPSPAQMHDIATTYGWSPYESVACWYLWQSLDNTPQK